MTLRQYLVWMTIGTLVAWGAFWLVLTYLNPDTAGALGLAFFYLALFLSITGSLTITGFGWRYLRQGDEVLFRHVLVSFRQGALLGLMVAAALFLQTKDLLTWWNMGLLVLGLTLLEYFWLTARRAPGGRG